jgi:predicted alpha/beta superfamily hydrolase
MSRGHAITSGERFTHKSRILGERREFWVRRPVLRSEERERSSILVVLDGEFFFPLVTAATEFLSERGYGGQSIPHCTVVGVVNVDRDRDFTPTHAPDQGRLRFPTSGGASAFLRYLLEELLPEIENRFAAEPQRFLSGWSLGGLFTAHVRATRPDAFAGYLAVSPSLWWDGDDSLRQVSAALEQAGPGGPPLVVTLGAEEGGDMGRSVREGFVPRFCSGTTAWPGFSFLEIPGETHEDVPYKAWFDGMRTLLGPASR